MSTSKFVKPAVGTVVTVTTRYAETLIDADSRDRDYTYENVKVLEPEKWFKPDDFKITSDDSNMSFRVINLNQVVDLRGGDQQGERYSTDDQNFTIEVMGSKGNTYTVTFVGGSPISCTCPGFAYRKNCRHLQEAKETVDTSSGSVDNEPRMNIPIL